MKLPFLITSCMALALPLLAQTPSSTPAAADQHVDIYSGAALKELAPGVIEDARKSPEGTAGKTLQHYPDHFTMLSARVKDGKAELHQHFADMFVVVSGTATLTTGGTIATPHATGEGEVRGDGIDGGTQQTLAPGAIVHIPAGVPHQLKMASTEPFVYYVVKVKQ